MHNARQMRRELPPPVESIVKKSGQFLHTSAKTGQLQFSSFPRHPFRGRGTWTLSKFNFRFVFVFRFKFKNQKSIISSDKSNSSTLFIWTFPSTKLRDTWKWHRYDEDSKATKSIRALSHEWSFQPDARRLPSAWDRILEYENGDFGDLPYVLFSYDIAKGWFLEFN